MIEISTLQFIISSIGICASIISSIIWTTTKITERMNTMDKTLVEIKTLLQATITRIEHIEKDLEKIDNRVSHLEKTIKWEK